MKLHTRLYLLKFSNHTGYCTGMRDYLKDEVQKGNLNYKQLKYLYNNLYKRKTNYIRQNIYPVSQAFIKGVSSYDIEHISDKLLDASEFTVFSVGMKNDRYNKLFKDLEFILNKYVDLGKKYTKSVSYRNTLEYIKLLNEARLSTKFIDDSIYDYVENNVKKYYEQQKDFFYPGLNSISSRHTISSIKNINKNQEKQIENNILIKSNEELNL